MVGYSNGCMMAQRFALEASELVAAVGCQSGYLLSPPAEPPASFAPMPIITVHGTADTVVPFTRDNSAVWARLNGCTDSSPSVATSSSGSYSRVTYAQCRAGVQVQLIELPSAGHASYHAGVPTTPMVWAFLSSYQRSASSNGAVIGAAVGGGVAGLLLVVASLLVWRVKGCPDPRRRK